jgi:hypothetical protein
MNKAAKPRSNTSVTKAEPSLKNRPATAGKMAKARGDECQLLSSSSFCFLDFFVDEGFKRSSAKEPVASSKLEKERMEERRRGRSDGVERRLPLLDWRGGRRCLSGLEEEALYAVPEPVKVVAGGGRAAVRSDLASAMVGSRSTHGCRGEMFGGGGGGGVGGVVEITTCQKVRQSLVGDGLPNGAIGRVDGGCCWHCCLRQLREWPCGMPIKSRLVRRSKQGRSPVLAMPSCRVMLYRLVLFCLPSMS